MRLASLLGLLIGSLLVLSGGCGDISLVGIASQQRQTPGADSKIIRKHYSRPPLSRSELDHLMEMAIYTGRPEYYGDIILDELARENGRSLPVVFSHRTHRSRYACSVCHVELEFSMHRGETGITREDYLDGRYCGACHDGKRAFSTKFACDACHLEIDVNAPDYPSRRLVNQRELPETSYGDRINWVEALKQGSIRPLKSLSATAGYPSMPLPEHLKQPLLWRTANPRSLVRFPHVEHVAWLDCANCHPDLFSIKQTGTVEFRKEANMYGAFCGTCHMTIALPMDGCSRCHPSIKDHH